MELFALNAPAIFMMELLAKTARRPPLIINAALA
jgi:hypothetical protein